MRKVRVDGDFSFVVLPIGNQLVGELRRESGSGILSFQGPACSKEAARRKRKMAG
ncbi:hypothetical protein [Bdellovibrio sp. BCCA]|uniref:hypothetical protein n=1 Tax=Bdellovibrio sp. BCCA TaxID=3136281 RepID=UPI0030F1C28A